MPGRQNLLYTQLAAYRKWDEVYAQLDIGEAGVDDFDKRGMTALHVAAWDGAADVIDELVRRGAYVDAMGHSDRCTPLHLAAINSKTDAVKRLVRHGADLNARNQNGRTALHEAACAGAVDVIDALVRRGATVDAMDNWDQTPLLWAASLCKADAAKRLVHLGADLNAEDMNGDTPIELALRYEHTELATWLEQAQLKKAGARRNWATARAFVQVYPYALFWHAYVGEQLCAPGGKWAERDRAAFEEEFNELRR